MEASPVIILITPAVETLDIISANYNDMARAIGSEFVVVFQDKDEALARHSLMFNRYLDVIGKQKVTRRRRIGDKQ